MAEDPKTPPAFDPSAPIESAPAFDPSAPIEAVPAFDPSAPVENIRPLTITRKKPKRDLDTSKFVFDPMTGAMGSTDPEDDKLLRQQVLEQYKGVASGAAQTLVGVPQAVSSWTPGHKWLDDYFAETQQTLKEFGSPEGQTIGGMLPYALGGEILGGLRAGAAGASRLASGAAGLAGEYIPGVAKLGEYLAPTGEAIASGAKAAGGAVKDYAGKVIPETLKKGYGLLTGAAPEAEAATTAAQAKDLTLAEASLKTLKEGLKGTATGVAGGAGLGVIAPRAEKTQEERNKKMWDDIRFNSAVGGALGLAAGVTGPLAEIMGMGWEYLNPEQKRLAVEAAEKAIEDVKQGAVDTATKAVKSAKSDRWDTRRDVAAAETALSPTQQKIEELAKESAEAERRKYYEPTDEQARNIAGQTNLTEPQAKAFVKEQQRLLDAIKEETEKQSAKQFAGTAPKSDVALGKEVATPVEKLKTDLEAHRKKESGLAKIDAEYADKGPVFPIKPVIEKINEQIKGVKSGLQKGETVNFLERLKTRLEDTAKKLGDDNKITLKQLDDARLEIKDAVNNGIIGISGGVRTAGADVEKLRPVSEGIDSAFSAVDERYGAALKKYGVLSEALAPFEQEKGVFTGTTEKFYGGPNEMLPRDIAIQILDRTRGGGEGLETLIKENPQLKDTFREYLHGELFGASEESASDVTAKALDEFRKENAEVLKSTGLTDEFADLSAARRANEQTIKKAEKRLAEAETLKTETTERLSAEEGRRKFETDELKKAAKPHEEMISEGAKKIKDASDAVSSIRKLRGDLDAAKKPKDMLRKTRVLAAELKKLSHEGVLDPKTMTPNTYDSLVKTLDKIDAEYTRSGDALKATNDLRTTIKTGLLRGALAGAGASGVAVPSYGVWRALRGTGEH